MKRPGFVNPMKHAGCVVLIAFFATFALLGIGCQFNETTESKPAPATQAQRSHNLVQHAESLRMQGRYVEARQHVLEALHTDPSNTAARQLLLRIDRDAGRD